MARSTTRAAEPFCFYSYLIGRLATTFSLNGVLSFKQTALLLLIEERPSSIAAFIVLTKLVKIHNSLVRMTHLGMLITSGPFILCP